MEEFSGLFEWFNFASDTWWGRIVLAILAIIIVGRFFQEMFLEEDSLKKRVEHVETEAGQRAVQSYILIRIARYTKWCAALLFVILLFMIVK